MLAKVIFTFAAATWCGIGFAAAKEPLVLASPDDNLQVAFELKSNPAPYLPGERPYYRVSYKGAPVLTDSPLGLDFIDMRPMDRDFELLHTARDFHDETWENPFGTARQVRNHYHELSVSLREKQAPFRRVDVIFRAYNDGLAFRYFLPREGGLENFVISSDRTGFYFAREGSTFALNIGRFQSPYESEFEHLRLDQIKPTSIIGLPLLVELTDGPWVAITEADLTDYAGLYVGAALGVPNGLAGKLSPMIGHAERAVAGSTPKATPWRVIMVNSRPGGLIESSELIMNLSQPNQIGDTSWIQSGKAAWDWWSGSFARNVDFKPGMNTATMMHYVDFAAEHHLEYMLIDAGWSPHGVGYEQGDITRYVPEVDVPAIVQHARAHGVKVLIWLYWSAVKKQIDAAFPLYEKWGVSGVKIDFMERDDQEMVNFYQEMVSKAARYHLTVDFHGAYKPTGLRRAYPNLLTREGIMGMEYSKWSTRVTPEHDVTIPFTRNLAGPMDYTPGCFQNATREQFQPRNVEPMCQGTRAHQLAMYVVFFSPLAMLSDYPESYDRQPGMEFLEKVPTVWDETRVPNGEPSKYVTIARRHRNTWYLGSMTNWDARDLEVPLSFLGSGTYEAQVFADGADADKVATSLEISRQRVSSGDKLKLHLAPGGGAAAIFTPTAP
ncbi:MAG TPA: glycoside hydrolase family 97 protein [Terriglobia bacterium]|nr:glycoside hydrolase family 97 protein [Terriglobia bacterium]